MTKLFLIDSSVLEISRLLIPWTTKAVTSTFCGRTSLLPLALSLSVQATVAIYNVDRPIFT